MRKFIDIMESVDQWPATITGLDLSELAQSWHHTPEDFTDGDIDENIMTFGVYHLTMLPMAKLRPILDLYSLYDDLVDDYALRDPKTSPPIVYEPQSGIILDGNHRANAAEKRGDDEILAYVADPASYVRSTKLI